MIQEMTVDQCTALRAYPLPARASQSAKQCDFRCHFAITFSSIDISVFFSFHFSFWLCFVLVISFGCCQRGSHCAGRLNVCARCAAGTSSALRQSLDNYSTTLVTNHFSSH